MNNNDLSMLLKSQVVELKAKLDVSESISDIRSDIQSISKSIDSGDLAVRIPVELYATLDDLNKDIQEIQKRLKGSNSTRKVELEVKLDANLKDLQEDIRNLQSRLENSKTTKPIKIDVEINVQGSAKKIKEQFDQIQRVLEDFQRGYGGKLDAFSKQAGDAIEGLAPRESVQRVTNTIEQMRKEMSEGFGEGIFSAKQVSNSKGQVEELVGTMKLATGEIQTLRYKWNSEQGDFVLVKQQDVIQTEANSQKVAESINKIFTALDKLETSEGTTTIRAKAQALLEMDNASMDAVRGLEELTQAESRNQQMAKAQERAYDSLGKMLREIGEESSFASKNLDFLEEGIVSAKTLSDLKAVQNSIDSISTAVKEENKFNEARSKILTDIVQKENQLAQLRAKMPTHLQGANQAIDNAEALIRESRALAESAENTSQLTRVRSNLNKVTKEYISTANTEINIHKNQLQVEKLGQSVEKTLVQLRSMGKITDDELGASLKRLDGLMDGSIDDMQRFGNEVSKQMEVARRENQKLLDSQELLAKSTSNLSELALKSKMFDAIDRKDTEEVKKYVGEMYGAEVATAKFIQTTDSAGRVVDRVQVKMQGTGKTVEAYTIDIDKAGTTTERSMRQISQSTEYNANRNLGMLEQLRIAMERVPIWAVATSTFYGFIRMTKQAVDEIMKVDAAITELKRVAGENINLDILLDKSVEQSLQLGSNIHDVLGALGEATRTFGEFNEQALMAVTRTAVMMDNVSDLNLDESMNSLIGTMNAFNITAEESIKIVDAFNEVDNQFAISTQQIATAMSKAGATAQTFGVEMEEVVGHVTAIGSVTMESGERLGNSLKTIYSRITTLEPAIEIIESVGVAINEIGENGEVAVRDVSEILGDLADVWDELSDSQRQNIGVQVAGRNQLSRFLALMNNWQTSIDATTTAYGSQGSALREQGEYMDSYEAKLNQVQTRITELSLAVGDAFLNDTLFAMIEGLGKVIELITEFVDRFGVLPALLGTAGTAFSLLYNDTGKLGEKIRGTLSASIDGFTGKIKDVSTIYHERMTVMSESTGKVVTSLDKAKTGIGAFGTAFKGVLVGMGITALLMAVGWAIEKMVKHTQEVKRAQEEWNATVETAVESYNKHGNSINSLIDEYDVLNQKMETNKEAMSDEEIARYNELVNELQTMLPQIVDHVDANGQAHLRSTDAIKEEAQWLERLATEQKEMIQLRFYESIEKNAESMTKMIDKLSRAREEIANTQKVMEQGTTTVIDYGAGGSGQEYTFEVDPEMYENQIVRQRYDLTRVEYEYNTALNNTIKSLQEYSLQMLTSDGATQNMTDTARRTVEQLFDMNKAYLDVEEAGFKGAEATEEFEKRSKDLTGVALELGEEINGMYGRLQEGLDGIELSNVTSQIDSLMSSIPKDAFTFPDGALDTSRLQSYTQTIEFLVTSIRNGDSDYQGMIATLESFGFSNNDASKWVAELGRTLDNNAIKSALAREELEYFNEELSDTSQLAFEAINPLEAIFGMSGTENQAVISYLETLKLLKNTTSDWQETSTGQRAIDQLANYFGVSRGYISENVDLIHENWNALNSTTQGYYDVLDEAGNQVLTESGEVMQKYGLIFAEGTSDTAKAFVEEMYRMSIEGGGALVSNFAQSVGAVNYITDEMVDNMKAELATLAQDPEGNFSGFFNLLQEHLNVVEGSFTLVEDSAGRLKFAMADGTESGYLNMVNDQLEALDMQVSWTQSATTGLWEVLITDPNGKGAPVVSKVTQQAKDGSMAINELKEQYGEFLNDTTNEEQQSKYLATIQRQAQLVGEELVLATDEAGNAKLEFADGSSSAWLDELNRQLDESKEAIKLTTDDTGKLKIEMATGGQAVFLDDLLTKTGKLSTTLGDAEGRLGTFKQSLQGGMSTSPQRIHATDHTLSGGQMSSGGTVISTAYQELEKMSDKIDEVNAKEVTPQVNQKVNSDLQEINININKTKTNVERLNVDIETIQGAMSTVQSGLDTVVSVGSTLTGITGYATQLRDALSEARNQLAVLIEESQRGGINFAGFHSAVTSIEGLTTRMKISVEGIKQIYNDMIISTANLGNALNLQPIRDYQTGFNLNLLKINSDYSSHVRRIQDEVNKFRLILASSSASLRGHSDNTRTQLSVMGVYYTSFKNNAGRRIEELAESVTTKYMSMVVTISRLTQNMRETMDSSMSRMRTASVASMNAMGDAMVRSFRDSVSKIQAEARRLPSLIGGGIRDNITSATSAINDLATNLVTNFKSALGIHSPSRVFEELGGFVMQGLVNGLSDGNLLDLGSKVFSEFGNGAFSTLDMIKGYLSADWAVANGDVQDWISSAVGITGVPASWIAPLTQIAMHESGGNPRAINDWDINAQNGIPSKGLMQTIDPTFSANMMAGFGDIWNPVHNAIASINYILRRYGNVFNVPGIKGLMNGTGYVGYGESTDTSAESMQTSFTSDVGSYASTFASSAEFGGEASGGGFSSAVGNMMPTINTFTTSATDYTNNRYEREETMEDLRVIDWRKREADVYSAMIRRANTELQALNESTYAYRNALVEVNRQEDEYRKRLQYQLSNQKNIHKSLTSQLEALSNTSKHSIEQRKRYNELQGQFESSLDTIYSLENEIRGLEISIADRTVAIFEDYIGEIVTKYAESIEKSNANIDNIDFKLSLNEYSETDTLLDNMRLENEKLGHLLGQEKTIRNQIADLNTAHKNAQSRYGKNSQQATLAYEAMLQAEEDLEDAILARLAQEKKFSDERKRVSDEGIKTLKDYYSTVRDITTSALEAERKELEKNHDLRMTMYDEEIARINQIYDAKIESLDADKEENKYNEEMNQKNSERVELMNQISRVSRDNSLDGRKQLAELQAQLGTLNEEILTLQTERQDKLYRDAIEAQRQQQIKAIETQKETAEKEYDIRVEGIELQVEQAKEAYDSMINDEAMWQGLTERYLAGDTNPLMSMIENMENQMAKMMAGDYSSILPNFSELPRELRDEITSGNMLDLSNLTVGMSKTLEDIKDMTEFMNRYAMSGAIGGVNHGDPRLMDDSYKTKYSSSVNIYAPKNTAPTKTPEPPAPAKPQRTHTISAGDTLWDLAERFYGNPFKWTTIAQANSNPDPYKLQIGRKLIIPFKTGGYTGDWADNDGRIAMLHKKELVLNEEQTQHILNSAKIMDSVMRMIPKMKVNQGTSFAGQGGGGQTIIIENMPLHFDNFRGTKDDANNMVKEFMTGLKKL